MSHSPATITPPPKNSGEPNWKNKTIWTGDNLDIMRGMNSESIDLIYLDPPFNSNADYAAPIGSKAAGAEFKDIWTLNDIDNAWLDLIEAKHPQLKRVIQATMRDSDKSYLIYMTIRLLEMKRLLKETGSIYLHCDPTMSHYLKLVMDSIFGRDNFANEIVWNKGYRGTPRKNRYQQEHDIILFYSRGSSRIWNKQTVPYKDKSLSRYNKVDSDGNRYALIKRRKTDGTVYYGKCYPQGKLIGDVITIPTLASTDRERTGYPTQKPLALLERIIKASSNEGDIILDCFCGCATTCVTADALNRQWVGIDIGEKAAELVRARINDMTRQIIHRSDIPHRTDLGKLPPYQSHRQTLYGYQNGNCNGCSNHFQIQNLTVDHIIARSKGGTDHLENLQLLCGNCNSVKGDRGMEYLIAKLRKWNS